MSEALESPPSLRAGSRWLTGVLVGIALLAGAGLPHANRLSDVDTFWHLAAGEEALDQGKLWLTEDVFTYTVPEGQRETPPFYWGFQLMLAAADRIAGLPGIQALLVLLATLVAGLLYGILRRFTTATPVIAVAVAVAVLGVVAASRMVPRPQLLSMVFFLATLRVLETWRREVSLGRPWRGLCLMVPIFLVWANCHGPSLFVGCLLFACYLADAAWRWRREGDAARRDFRLLALVCVVSWFASLVSAASLTNYTVLVGYSDLTARTIVNVEYQHLWNVSRVPFLCGAGFLLLGTISLVAVESSRRNVAWWFSTLGFAAMGAWMFRFIDVAALAAALPLAAAAEKFTRKRGVMQWLLAAAVVALLLCTTVRERRERYGWGADEQDLPVRAASFVLAQEGWNGNRLFCDQYFGGYLSWHTRGRYKISWDGRTWLYYDMLGMSRAEALQKFWGHVLVLRSFPLDLPTGPEQPLQPDTRNYALVYVDRAARVYRARSQPGQPVRGEYTNLIVTEAGFTLNVQNLPAAQADLERMAASGADNPSYWFALGQVHMMESRLAEAEAAFRQALVLQPGQPGSLLNLAALLNQSRPAEAIELLLGAEESEPFAGGRNHAQLRVLYLNRAAAQMALGQKDAARLTLETCLKEFPGDRDAQQMIRDLGAR